MHSHHSSAFVAFAFAITGLVGCSGNDGAISVEPAASPLTESGGDALFTVKVDKARSEGYAFATLKVKVEPESGDAIAVACEPNDANANDRIDEGESLACKEGADNAFGAQNVGKEVTVKLYAAIDGEDVTVGDAKWNPK